jgi:hypothetical protein
MERGMALNFLNGGDEQDRIDDALIDMWQPSEKEATDLPFHTRQCGRRVRMLWLLVMQVKRQVLILTVVIVLDMLLTGAANMEKIGHLFYVMSGGK